jgi:hypothetical protein
MSKEKAFDCVKFKNELQNNLLKKSGAKNIREYVEYVNKVAQESSLHKPNVKIALKNANSV